MHQARALRRAARLLSYCAAVGMAQVLLPALPARAADIQWVGTNGQWKDAINWSLNRTPASPDNVLLTHSANNVYNVQYIPSTQPPASYLSPLLGNIHIDATAAGWGMNLVMQQGYRLDANVMTVGQTGSGAVFQTSGALALANDLYVARATNRMASYQLSVGSITANNIYVGAGGAGTFSQGSGQITIASNLVVGYQSAGTFNLSGGTLTSRSLSVGDAPGITGTLNITGGALNAAAAPFGPRIGHSGNAIVNHSGGSLNVPDSFVLFADLPGSSATYRLSGAGLITTHTSIVGGAGAATFEQTGGSHISAHFLHLAQSPGSSADYHLAGGLLSAGAVVLHPNSTLHQSGGTLRTDHFTQAGGDYIWSTGALEYIGNLTLASYADLGGRSTLTPDHALKVVGTAHLQTPLTLDGGALSTQVLTTSGGGALRFRRGDLSILHPSGSTTIGAGQILGQSLTIPSNSSVTLGGFADVQPDSVVLIDGGRFEAATIDNSGLIQLATAASRLASSTFTNRAGARLVSAGEASAETLGNAGQIILSDDSAALRSIAFTNSALLRGRGTIYSTFTNDRGAEVRAETGNSLRFLPSSKPSNANDPATNDGRLSLLGGSLDFATASLANTERGIISGRGTLTANLLDNAGAIHLSAGLSDIFAPLNVTGEGSVIVTGNAVATFHGPVNIEERTTFNVSKGATAVFLAPVKNSGLVTGGGAKHFEAADTSLGALSTSGASVIEPTGAVTATHIREASLTVHGSVRILPGGTDASASRLGLLSILPGGQLDVTNNDLVLDNADYLAVASLISDGRLTASSSSAITHLAAVSNRADDGSPVLSTFDGFGVDANAVLVKYTYKGDSNVDGRISVADYFAADRGRALRLPGYQNGDFDYSGGFANADDYLLIDRAFLGQGAPLSPLPHSPTSPSASPVPEPAALTSMLLASALLTRRRLTTEPLRTDCSAP